MEFKVLVSAVEFWTKSKFFFNKVFVEHCEWDKKYLVYLTGRCQCLMGKLISLPIRICFDPCYSSELTFKLAKSDVRWWDTPESWYQLFLEYWEGVVKYTCMLKVESLWKDSSKWWYHLQVMYPVWWHTCHTGLEGEDESGPWPCPQPQKEPDPQPHQN